MLDGDASYPARYLPLFIKSLRSYDVVSGKRIGLKLKPKNIIHYIGNKIISLFGLLLFGKYVDICTGMWGFKGRTLKNLNISAKGFELEANFFVNIVNSKLKYKEIKLIV